MGADKVPETRDLETDEAWSTVRRVRYWSLVKGSVNRMRAADAFSYGRGVAFQIVLAAFPALIFFVGIAAWTGSNALQTSVDTILSSLAPGSTSDFLRQAVEQGEENSRGQTWPVLLGGLTALTSGAIGMSQIEQGANRIYGQDRDRRPLKRYGVGLALALSVGLLLGGALVALAFGGSIADAVEGESIWAWLRWPLGAAAVVVALAALYQVSPYRDQPGVAWLLSGGLTATVLWLLFSAGLAAYLNLSSTFGETYGPLAGLVGFLIWAQLTGVAVLGGLAFAAQLEAERVAQTERTESSEG